MAVDYEEFVDKFKVKKTTDDCYTPDNVYNAVLGWVCDQYGVDPETVVRPFWPGANYEEVEYAETAVVVDNPPFSIISRIIRFYGEQGVKFFLFAPALTLLSPTYHGYCGLGVGVSITYENGAKVATSFVTNLEDACARSCPELYRLVTEANQENERKLHRTLPRYAYPNNVVTSTFLQKLSKYGVDFCVTYCESERISALDSQRARGKTIFGKGLLVSDSIAAEKAAAEKENVCCWELSAREKEIIAELGARR